MHRILILICCIFGISCFLFSKNKTIPYHQIINNSTNCLANSERLPEISQINKLNLQIQTISAEIDINNGHLLKLSGAIAYQKNNKFRMQINSVFGREADVGSNDNIFWFYSKRMKPPYLYYSRHKDATKTRLKPLFNPIWLMESLSLDSLPNNYLILVNKERIELSNWEIGLNGELVLRKILVDPKKPAIIGHYLIGANGKLIASSEIISYYKFKNTYIPKKIKFIWLEENENFTLELRDVKINMSLPTLFWQMPRMKNTLDMGREPH